MPEPAGAGLNAEILTDGEIAVGDVIEPTGGCTRDFSRSPEAPIPFPELLCRSSPPA
jgi:hypothetical protein